MCESEGIVMKDTQTKERFIELRAQGWSHDRIARELKVTKPTLIRWARELHSEISNLRALELDALQDKFALTKLKGWNFMVKNSMI